MIEYTVLGCSSATVSMILESIYRHHPGGAEVRIVINTDIEDYLPFEVEGVDTSVLTHDAWDHQKDSRDKVPLICGVYKPGVKRTVIAFFRDEFGVVEERYTRLIHPSAELASSTRLGRGVYLGPKTIVAPYTTIGNFVSLNRAVTIGHHTTLADFVTINPAANVAGRCSIGEGVTLGMGCNVVDGVSIGARSVIGAGSVVTGNIPEGVLALGVPARIVRDVK